MEARNKVADSTKKPRGRGRPVTAPPRQKISVRLLPESYDKLWNWAHHEKTTITALTTRILEEALAQRQDSP